MDKIERLETLATKQEELNNDPTSSELLDLYGAAAHIDFVVGDRRMPNEMDDNL